MIFKFQRPIFTTSNNPLIVFAYNEDRSIQQEFEVDQETMDAIFINKDDYKVFLDCVVTDDMIEPITDAPWQEW